MWLANLFIFLVKLLIGAHPRWVGCAPNTKQRIYFANHSSHLDALTIWAALPPALREHTHPVAARDYWDRFPWRRKLALQGFNAIFIERQVKAHGAHPLQSLIDALERGDSLILFPEGTRNIQALPSPFKGGLHHLTTRFPDVELIPVYLENLYRSMPKGTFIPIPLICTVRFGTALTLQPDEPKRDFLERARAAVVQTATHTA